MPEETDTLSIEHRSPFKVRKVIVPDETADLHISAALLPPGVIPTFASEKSRTAALEAEVEALRSQLEGSNSQLKTALAHSVCAGWEIKGLKERLNSKLNKKKGNLQVNAQYISSADAIRMLAEQERKDVEKRWREEEPERRRGASRKTGKGRSTHHQKIKKSKNTREVTV
jgi:hypothetical protein